MEDNWKELSSKIITAQALAMCGWAFLQDDRCLHKDTHGAVLVAPSSSLLEVLRRMPLEQLKRKARTDSQPELKEPA